MRCAIITIAHRLFWGDRMKKKKDRTKVLYYVIAAGCIFLFMMLCLSSVLDIGERLRNVSKYLEWGFYFVFALVLILLIVRPIYIIVNKCKAAEESLKKGLEALQGVEGVLKVSAGNYGGNLGKYKFYLRDILE